MRQNGTVKKRAVSNSKKILIKLQKYDEYTIPTDKEASEFKQIYKQVSGIELTYSKAKEVATNLVRFFAIIINIECEEEMRRRKLKRYPKGFHLPEDETYTCPICHQEIEGKNSWYDDCGFKCLICQKALDKRILPKYVFKKDDTYWKSWELKSKFGLHYSTVKKLIREKKLKPRNIRAGEGGIYHQIFIKKENEYLNKLKYIR